MELIVSGLPAQTVDSSLYSEGTDGVRILTTRFRTRAVQEDTREEVRAKEQQINNLRLEAEKLQQQVQVIEQNLALLAKLENFTGATMQQLAEKGLLNAQTTIQLSEFVMNQRAAKAAEQTDLQQQIRTNAEQQAFAQRQLTELTAGSSRTERDAVIVADKTEAGAKTIRLNYLVSSASWSPQYKLRAQADNAPVQIEYLAAIVQRSDEDWRDASIVLSTAEPLLSAAPPELVALDITVGHAAAGGAAAAPLTLGKDNFDRAQRLREEAQKQSFANDYARVAYCVNEAAALEQTDQLLNPTTNINLILANGVSAKREGPSVTYHLKNKFTIPSRNDEQLIEVARLEMKGDFFYKAVPLLTPHVYRLANLINDSDYILLPGQATMYLGADFVGRTDLPLVAVGEQFAVGFGVDPQLQVSRELIQKNRSVQGGNQVHDFKYRIRVASYKSEPAKVQVWDRLPRAEEEMVGVTLISTTPSLSDDAAYLRTDRPANLLRWDLTVPPDSNGEKALTVDYQFKLEYDRNVAIGDFKARQ